MSNLKYTRVKTYIHGDPPSGWAKEYDMAMLCDNNLYFRVPADSSQVTLLDYKSAGYDAVSECWEAIEEAIGYLPNISFGLPYMSSPGFTDFDFMQILDNYMFQQYIEYTWWKWYATTSTSDTNVGEIELTGNTVSRACASFMYIIDHARLGDNYGYMQDFPDTSRHMIWEFTIFPYDLIRKGVFDFSTLNESTGHPGDQDWKRYCNVKFEIWNMKSGDHIGKWQCRVFLYGYDRGIADVIDYYDGRSCVVYDSGKPLRDPDEKENPQGTPRTPDLIPIPNLPTSDMTTAGSLRIYTLSAAQVKQIFEYLHSHDPGASVLKWWANPMQAIISLHYLPYALPLNGATEEFKVLGTPTGLMGFQPTKQFVSIHFGYIDLMPESGTYLDYSPYTKVSIYLPGVGIRELNTDDVMNKRIWVVYHCDNVTGQFAAYIATGSIGIPENQSSVKYTFSGQVAASFPITQENWGNTYIAGATLAAGALATGVVAAGAGAAAGGGAAAGEAAGTAAAASETGTAISAGNVASGVVSVGNSLSNLAKPTITRSGAVSGATSLFAVKKPYLIIESPSYYSYNGFDSTKGYPYGLYMDFASLSGYAVIEGVHLNGIPATATEISEIEALLKAGVHF